MSKNSLLSVWQEFARSHEARLEYIDDRTASGREEIIKMDIQYRFWTFEFSCHSIHQSTTNNITQYTRIKSEILNKDHFSFNLYPEKVKHLLYKIMGLQDIIIGDNELDRRYIIQANDDAKLKELLKLDKVRSALESEHIQRVGVIDDEENTNDPLPHYKDILLAQVDSRLQSTDQLNAHLDLLAHILDGLLALDYIQGE